MDFKISLQPPLWKMLRTSSGLVSCFLLSLMGIHLPVRKAQIHVVSICAGLILTLLFVQEEAGRSQQGSQRRQHNRGHTRRWLHCALHQEPLPRPEGRQTRAPVCSRALGQMGASTSRKADWGPFLASWAGGESGAWGGFRRGLREGWTGCWGETGRWGEEVVVKKRDSSSYGGRDTLGLVCGRSCVYGMTWSSCSPAQKSSWKSKLGPGKGKV